MKPPLPRRAAPNLVDEIDTQELADCDLIPVSSAHPPLPLSLDGLSRLGARDAAAKTDELLAFDTASEDDASIDDEVTTTRLPALAPIADAAVNSTSPATPPRRTPFHRRVASEPSLVLGPLPGGGVGSLVPVATIATQNRAPPSLARAYAPWIAGALVAGSLVAVLIIQPRCLSRLMRPNASVVASTAVPMRSPAATADRIPTEPPVAPVAPIVDDSPALALSQPEADDAGHDLTASTPTSPVKSPGVRPAPRGNSPKRTATSAPTVLPDGTLDLSSGDSRANNH